MKQCGFKCWIQYTPYNPQNVRRKWTSALSPWPLALAPPVLWWSVFHLLWEGWQNQSLPLQGLMSRVGTLEPKICRSWCPTGLCQPTRFSPLFLEGLCKRIRSLGILNLFFPNIASWNDGIRNGQHHPTTSGLHTDLGFFLLFKSTCWCFQTGSKGIKPGSNGNLEISACFSFGP